MADDLGYGDVACYGNPTVLTPHLDEMANAGIRFERFYSAAPVCSPTRGSCLTGRHPYRYNMPWAGRYGLPKEEITIAEALKTKGYSTGHFGKWHVGGLSKIINQSEFPGGPSPYSPPWENGFDECFSTESMMPTYNPYYQVGGEFGTEDYRFVQNEPVEKGQKTGGFRWGDFYWIGEDKYVEDMPEGDDSKIIMDKALDFIERKSTEKSPFLSVIWFHTPHTPVVAGNEQRAKYPDLDIPQQHWFGAISAMDEQIGVLREKLRKLQIEEIQLFGFAATMVPLIFIITILQVDCVGKKQNYMKEEFECRQYLSGLQKLQIHLFLNCQFQLVIFILRYLQFVELKWKINPFWME